MTTTKPTRFYLTQAGREVCPLDGDRKACKAQVREIALGELKRAKAYSKSAHMHRNGDCYVITLGRDYRSSLWTSVGLLSE